MLSPILVGRDGHLEIADARLADAAASHGRTLLIAGEAGIGKSRFLGAVIRTARARGFVVVEGDLAPQDQDVPGALILDLARTMREIPALAAAGADILARWRDATERGAYSRTLVLDVVDRIRSAIDGPTVLAFEDVQWADDLSLEAIGELARTIDRRPIAVIATHRRDEAPPDAPLRAWRARLLTQRLAEEIRLDRLTPAQTATMVGLLLETGLPAPREVVEAVHDRSDGVPLHVEELVAAVRAEGPVNVAAIRDVTVPDTIEDAVLARTARLSPEAQAVARAGAVLGRCFVPEVLAGVMDRPVTELEDPLEELVEHAILYPFGSKDVGYHDFRHQLLREALYRHTPARERRRFHARAAEFGAVLDGANEVHASLHYERAGLRDEAYRAARAGAESAKRVSAHREAFELFRRAVDNLPDDLSAMERGELFERFGEEAGAIEQSEAAEWAWSQAQDAYREAGRPALAVGLDGGFLTIWRRNGRSLTDRWARIDAQRAALDALPEDDDTREARRWLEFDRIVAAVDANQHAAVLDEIPRLLPVIGDDLALDVRIREAMARVVSGQPDEGLATMTRLAGEARDAGREETGVTAYRDAAFLAVRSMDYRVAEAALAEGLVYADSIQQSHCAHNMAAMTATVAWAAGRWDHAILAAEQAVADHGCTKAPAVARTALGYVDLGRGRFVEAEDALRASLAWGDGSEMIEFQLPPRWGLAELALAMGEPTVAIDWCESALQLATAVDEGAAFAPFVVTGVRAFQAAGRPAEAERWLAACRERLAAFPAFASPALEHGTGLVALAAGSAGVARDALETAVAGWDAKGRVWEASWARLDLAAALARSNRYATAVAVAGQVRETALALDSPILLERAETIARQGRGRVTQVEPWHPLTTREFEVARLVSEGRTNVEIAAELGIAPKTASAHIEHILAKHGASRRTEIAAWTRGVAAPTTSAAGV